MIMTDEHFEQHALAVLRRKLGVAGLARFLRLRHPGSGDYTREREAWQHGLTVDQIAQEIREQAPEEQA